jgi:hypothetical protein
MARICQKHGWWNNKGSYFYFYRYLLLSSFKNPLLLMNSLIVRVCGCLQTMVYFPTLLHGRILPLYVAEGSKGASQGGVLLSATAE